MNLLINLRTNYFLMVLSISNLENDMTLYFLDVFDKVL